MLITLGIDLNEGLIKKRVFGSAASRVDHEVRARFAMRFGGAVDQNAHVVTYPQVDRVGTDF